MPRIQTCAFIVNEATYPLAVATMPPGFALIPVSKVYGEFVVLNGLFAMDTEHHGQVLAFGNARYQADDFWTLFAVDGDIWDGQLHAVHRI